MDSTLVPLITALIGAISGLLGGFLAGRRQSRLEHERWLLGRKDDLAKETRLAVAELTRKIASATHSIVWLAWKAKFRPAQLTEEDISEYDKETHERIPEIVGSLTVVSALNSEIYNKMAQLAERYYALDAEMAIAASAFRDSPKVGAEKISEIHVEAFGFNRELAQSVADIFREEHEA